MKKKIDKKFKKVLTAIPVAIAPLIANFAHATEGDTGGVTSAIETAASSVKADAAKVIAAAVGVGVVFWGARVLWSKFKGMAK